MRKSLYIKLFILISISAKAQFKWQNPNLTGESLNAICFQTPLSGWVVGNTGTLLNTNDGGNTWNIKDIGVCSDIKKIQFINSTEGWTIANKSLYHTIDGGQNWTPVAVSSYTSITNMCFVSSLVGWIRSEAGLLQTIDGGNTWTYKCPSPTGEFSFANPRKGWQITSFGGVKYTNDGGSTWITQHTGVNENITCISIIDSNDVWMSGISGLIHTNNGGSNWTINSSSRAIIGSNLPAIINCHFINSTTGWAISTIFEALIRTNDGGNTWIKSTIRGNAVHCFDAVNGIILGDGIFATNDGAQTTLNKLNPITKDTLYSVHFTDNINGWSVGTSGTIVHTNNGGINWVKQNCGTSSVLKSIYANNASEAWAAGNISDSILYTNNGGITWQKQITGTTNYLNKVCFINTSIGWCVGDNGTIIHSSNGGINWIPQISNIATSLNSVKFTNSQNGWIVGNDGVILNTTDGGNTWNSQNSGTTNHLKDIYFISATEGWAVGDVATILHTTDGGLNWILQPTNLTGDLFTLNSVTFANQNVGWATGYEPALLYTTDGGINWNPYDCGPSVGQFHSVHFSDENNGWIVGENGAILNINNGASVTQIEEHEFDENSLINIYPNPTSDFITVDIKNTYSTDISKANYYVCITNVLGQTELYKPLQSNKTIIKMNNLSKGIYHISLLKNNEIIENTKVIKN